MAMSSEQLIMNNKPRTINNKIQSIKNNKLCKTNPIYEEPKIAVTLALITNYNELLTMNCYSKQTQTNPILSASGGVFGFHVLNFAGTSRPWSVISFESDIIFSAGPSAIMRPLSRRTTLSAIAAAKFILEVVIIRV